MKRFSRKEKFAEFFSFDYSELNDYRYHYGRTSIPVWAFDDGYYCVTREGEVPAKYRDNPEFFHWELIHHEQCSHYIWISKTTGGTK